MRRLVRSCCALLALLMLVPAVAQAQDREARTWADSIRRAVETAYLSGNADSVVRARALAERALTRYPGDPWLLHYLGYALYREAVLRAGQGSDDTGSLLEQAQVALEQAGRRLELAETHALLSSVMGQRIGSNPLRGMMLGPKSTAAMERAMELGSKNPRVWVLRGIGAVHTPAMFGGGLDRAEEYLRRATELYADDRPQPPFPAWGHDEAWLWLGQVLQRTGRIDDARSAYERALAIEPRNVWVRSILLPGLDAKR